MSNFVESLRRGAQSYSATNIKAWGQPADRCPEPKGDGRLKKGFVHRSRLPEQSLFPGDQIYRYPSHHILTVFYLLRTMLSFEEDLFISGIRVSVIFAKGPCGSALITKCVYLLL